MAIINPAKHKNQPIKMIYDHKVPFHANHLPGGCVAVISNESDPKEHP